MRHSSDGRNRFFDDKRLSGWVFRADPVRPACRWRLYGVNLSGLRG